MTVKIAKTAGFCFGVRRAMEMTLETAHKKDGPIFTIGPLIHNQQAVELLRTKGVDPKEEPVDEGEGIILIRAHGIRPELSEELKLKGYTLYDATCPHVTRAQRLVQKHAAQGYGIIIIGDKGHAEVNGLLGFAQGRDFVVENEQDIKTLPSLDKVCVVAQTTQNEEKFSHTVSLIKKRFPQAVIFNTICGATSRRQQEARKLARQVDLMLVVGGRHSANTQRLVQICQESGTPTLHIETPEEINPAQFINYNTIGVTAGASTPHWIIRNVVDKLRQLEYRRKGQLIGLGYSLFQFIIYSQLLLALGAAGLTYVGSIALGIKPRPNFSLLAFFYVLSMHIVNRYVTLPKNTELAYGVQRFFLEHRWVLSVMGLGGIICAIALALAIGPTVFLLVIVSLLLGALYSFAIIPKSWLTALRYRRLMDIPGSKDLFMAFAWTVITVIMPFIGAGAKTSVASLSFFSGAVFLMVLIRSLFFDIRDIEGDIVLGNETLPIILGSKQTTLLLHSLAIAFAIIPLAGWILTVLPIISLSLVPIAISLNFIVQKNWDAEFYQSPYFDTLIDGHFLLAFFLAVLAQSVL